MANGQIGVAETLPTRPSYKFSLEHLTSYDKIRHLPVADALRMVADQGDSRLDPVELQKAVEAGQIAVYDFKGQKYLDRLDIGRVYHRPPVVAQGLTVSRHFTTEGEDPYAKVGPLKRMSLELKDDDGRVIFNMPDAMFPQEFREEDAKIVAQKYLFKPRAAEQQQKLKDKIGTPYENSFLHLVRRVTDFVTDEGIKLGYFATPKDAETFRAELASLQLNRQFAFNSPVQFNAGISSTYGISGSTNNYKYWTNPQTGQVERVDYGEFVHPQAHACFIHGPRDDLKSISDQTPDESAVFSSGSGIGQDLSVLRAEGEELSGGGHSSGPIDFLATLDRNAAAIKSGGKSRRAARMTQFQVNHPDVEKVVRLKYLEDKKALALMRAGFSGGMNGEAYATVGFQNTNISIRLTSEFFEAVEGGGDVVLKRVTDGKECGRIPARRLLQQIAYGSWRSGDPGVQYHDHVQEMHTTPNSGTQTSSNPCGEYLGPNDSACNLGSLNLVKILGDGKAFKTNNLVYASRIATVALDILNSASGYPIESVARISPEFRTVGLGFSNLGSLLMRRGIPYNSDEARALASAVTATMTGAAYETSAEIAESLGAFTHFELNRKPMLGVVRKHIQHLEEIVISSHMVPEEFKEASKRAWNNALRRGEVAGFRGSQQTVIAPTGTISFYMGCQTSGAEPAISLTIRKNLAGGGTLTLVNSDVGPTLERLGYTPEQREQILQFVKEHETLVGAPHVSQAHYPVFETAYGNVHGQGAMPFSPHVQMLGALQPFVSGGISKTCNLPSRATVKEVYDAFILGNKLKIKGLTMFRLGGKPISALDFGQTSYTSLRRGEKEDPPRFADSKTLEVRISGVPLHYTLNEYPDGRLAEVYVECYKAGSDLGSALKIIALTASTALKRGVDIRDILSKWVGHSGAPSGLTDCPEIRTASSPFDFIAKFIQLHYLGDTSVATEPDKINKTELRGYKNGAFRYFDRSSFDPWDIEQVLSDPETGGFVTADSQTTSSGGNDSVHNNGKGVACNVCGKLMLQTGPNCYECKNCGDKVGGCGA